MALIRTGGGNAGSLTETALELSRTIPNGSSSVTFNDLKKGDIVEIFANRSQYQGNPSCTITATNVSLIRGIVSINSGVALYNVTENGNVTFSFSSTAPSGENTYSFYRLTAE